MCIRDRLKASEHALDLASKDDFSYLGKLVPGQREGELGALFKAEDPELLHSIRRGDFQKEYDNSTQLVRYQDVLGHEISKREFEKLKDKSGLPRCLRFPDTCTRAAAASGRARPPSAQTSPRGRRTGVLTAGVGRWQGRTSRSSGSRPRSCSMRCPWSAAT